MIAWSRRGPGFVASHGVGGAERSVGQEEKRRSRGSFLWVYMAVMRGRDAKKIMDRQKKQENRRVLR